MNLSVGNVTFHRPNTGEPFFSSSVSSIDMEPDTNSLTKESLSFDMNMEFQCDSYINTKLLCDLAPNQPYKVTYDVPIMIQSRWHKKPRVNKKWLKRYGMKPDVVKVEMDVDQIEYSPGEYIDKCETGIIATYNNYSLFNFEAKESKFVFRNDQLIKHRKVEFV